MSALDPVALPIRAQVLALRAGVEADLRALAPARGDAQAAASALPWRTGERLQAVVESALAGNRYLVRVDQLAFDVQLPADVRVGDKLQLTYAGATPRPQFVLVQEEPAPAAGASARLDLSREGRALAAALAPDSAAEEAPARNSAPLLPAPTPLLETTPGSAAPLVAALKAALDSSGLFYESHLGEWIEGQRPLETLRREPQAQLRPGPAPVQVSPAPNETTRVQVPTADSDTPVPSFSPTKGEPAAIHAQALPLVRGQLETLETGQLVWTGQAWPGQRLEWRLREVQDEGRNREEPVPWSTQLRLTLPRLGTVTADLQLAGNSLRLRLTTAEPSARTELEAGRQTLATSLMESGLLLAGFAAVDQHD